MIRQAKKGRITSQDVKQIKQITLVEFAKKF